MLEETKTKERIERHHITQEDFTPDSVVEQMYSYFPDELYTDFTKTVLDPCCGIGNLLLYAVKCRLNNCRTKEDVYSAISTIYGTELMQDNVYECKVRICDVIVNSGIDVDMNEVHKILDHNIVCTDTFGWNYELWCKLSDALF